MRWLISMNALLMTGVAWGQTGPLLYPLFQDHAVLQRDRAVQVWGTTEATADVTVSIAGHTVNGRAEANGAWSVSLPAIAAGGPYELVARSSNGQSQVVRDVLVGDVWLCSGQSNMEMPVNRVTNWETELNDARYPQIRLLTVQRASSDVPLTSITAPVTWSPVAPESIREFAATCYFFGRDLHKANGVPQGLIHSSWGGSIIQAWTSATALRELKSYDSTLQLMQLHARNPAVAESQWKQSQQRWWEQHDPNQKRWSSIDADDAGWPAVRPRDFWEKSGIAAFNEFDGIVWFRTSVVLSDKQANQPASLSLGPVDDVDETWVNGRRIGSMEGWNVQRDYQISKGVLRSGRNVIAVGVLDSGGGGGLWGEPSQRKLQLASGEAVSLDAEWRYQVSGSLTQVGAAPSAPWMTAVGTTTLYNAMIAPLAGYTLRGVAWYQGESNAMEAEEYARLLPLMMKDWRNAFGNDLPFLVVQLAAFGAAANSPSESPWAELRETQRRVVNADGNAALATAVDIGDRFDIHPTNKQEVGRRLALAARRLVFHENIAAAGPEAMTARRDGAKVIIGFANAGGGLQVNGGNRPAGFELCDSSRQCSFVDAAVEQDRVVLEASAVPGAVKVRYAWAKSPVCNLYNQQQLPALPFEMSIQ